MTSDNRNQYQGGGRSGYGAPNRQGPGSRTPSGYFFPSEAQTKAIIAVGDSKTLVDCAEKVGRQFSKSINTTQIRKLFATVKRIEMNWDKFGEGSDMVAVRAQREFALFTARLAYYAKKEQGRALIELERVLRPAALEVGTDRGRFSNFVDYFEAIVAYHRAGESN